MPLTHQDCVIRHDILLVTMESKTSNSYLDQSLYLLFALVVIAAYIPTLVVLRRPLTSPLTLVLLVIGVLYLFNGLVVFRWVDQRNQLPLILLYFAIQLLLALAASFIGPVTVTMWLMILPLVSQAVVILPRRWTVAFTVISAASLLLLSGFIRGWGNALGSFLAFGSSFLFVVVFTEIFVRERDARDDVERLAHRLEQVNDQLRAYAAQAEEMATIKERNRLAREIHDNLGHYLTVINVQLEAARAVFDLNPASAREAVTQAQSLTKEGLGEVRRSVAALRASLLEGRQLTTALDQLLEGCRTAGMLASLTVTGEVCELPPQVEHTIYRATQEGLTNVRKHARAPHVLVDLDYGEGNEVRLAIEDDGVGAARVMLEEGFGLLGIRERVQLLGGELSLETAPSAGFQMQIRIPND